MRHFANGILLMMGKLADIVLRFRLVAFLDASRLSAVGVVGVVLRPYSHLSRGNVGFAHPPSDAE
jgi:hypothetical protein